MTDIQFLDTDAAFALRLKQLHDRLSAQMADAMIAAGLTIPAKTTGIVQYLHSRGEASQADIANDLRYSHQLTAQRLTWLLKNAMAVTQDDPQDARRRLIKLTDAGSEEARKLQAFLPMLRIAYQDLFAELQIDLNIAVSAADDALAARPLGERIATPASPRKT